jgi:hypothetical protein
LILEEEEEDYLHLLAAFQGRILFKDNFIQGCPEVENIGGGTIFWKFFENIYEKLLEKLCKFSKNS